MVSATLLDTLTDIGAIGGTLAIIGVGLLILLVAAQAREIRSMREWIEAEPERQQETTQRVIAEVQRRIAAARERRQAAKAGTPVAQTPSIPPPAPRAPAPGTLGATPEAQALAATKEGESAKGAADAPTTASPRFAPLTPAAAPAPDPDDPGTAGDEDGEQVADDLAAPAEVGDDDVPAVVAAFTAQDTVAADALPDQEEDELALPPFAASRASSREPETQYSDERFDFDEEPRSRSGRILVGGGLLALLVGIVLLGSQLFGGGDEPSRVADDNATEQSDGGGDAGTADTPAEPERIDPATINVQVLNGTQITGLAQRVTDRIKAQGYGTGQPETASDGQTIANESTVAYRQGNQRAAEQVAEELGLSTSAVRAMSAETAAAIGETFEVVVTAGQDLDGAGSAGTSG